MTRGSGAFLGSVPYLGWFLKKYVGPLVFGAWRTGAMTIAFAAAGKDVVDDKGKYQGAFLMPMAAIKPASSFAEDPRLQRELYDTTEKFVKEMGL